MQKLALPLILLSLSACTARRYTAVLASTRSGHYELYLSAPKDTALQRLTESKEIEYNMAWAHRSNTIFYTYYLKKSREIRSLNLDTREKVTLLGDSTIKNILDVSSNDQHLLINTSEHEKSGEIYLYVIRTQTKTRLTNNAFSEAGAKFSPVSDDLVVASIQTKKPDTVNHGGNAEIFLLQVSTGTTRQLTNMNGFSGLPSYSPNGEFIAFHNCDQGQCDVYVMKNDGTGLTNLTKNKEDNRWPRWTPDGKWIAFTRTVGNYGDIYLVSPRSGRIKAYIISPNLEEIAEFKPFIK